MLDDLRDLPFFATNFFSIRSKSGQVKNFTLNRCQLYLHKKLEEQRQKTGKVRAVVLKGRQQGCSTYIQSRYTHKVITNRGLKAYILTHEAEATNNLFEMTRRFIDHLPQGLCPKPDNSAATKLYFKAFDSGYAVGTAGNKGAGRSQTLQLFHGSEVAFWPHAEQHAKGVMQAISRDTGTEIILESTANGMGNYYHHMWQAAISGESEYVAIFLPWYWQDEYVASVSKDFVLTEDEQELFNNHKKNGLTLEHLVWRRLKIRESNGTDIELGTEQFKQEYPMTAAEAFRNPVTDTFINATAVMRARKQDIETDAGLIIGVDPALGEKDKFAIIRRRGRRAYALQRHVNHNTMQIAGLIRKIIEVEKPVKVYIDVIGIGAGIVDRLLEMGFDQVEGINSARNASDKEKYANKRAEMWAEMREWLNGESPVQLPDSDVLHADLCGLGYRWDSNGRLLIERKEDLKKRGLPSPDCFIAGTMIMTPDGLKPIEMLNVGDKVVTPFGITKIYATMVSQTDKLTTAKFSNQSSLTGKGKHKVFSWRNGFSRLDSLSLTFDKVEEYSQWKMIKWKLLRLLCIKEKSSEFKPLVDIISHNQDLKVQDFFIELFGQNITEKYQKVTLFITKIIIGVTMIFQTWKLCPDQSMHACTQKNIFQIPPSEKKMKLTDKKQLLKHPSGIDQNKVLSGILSMVRKHGRTGKERQLDVQYAQNHLKPISRIGKTLGSVHITANKKKDISAISQIKEYAIGAVKSLWLIVTGKSNVVPISVLTESVQMTKVYNLTLEKHNVYYANGILVTNCADALALTFAGGFYDISHGEQATLQHKIDTKGKFF